MRILAIDPGTTQSGYVVFEPLPVRDPNSPGNVLTHDIVPNEQMVEIVRNSTQARVVIEMMTYCKNGGAEILETCVWVGRLMRAATGGGRFEPARITRPQVKSVLCPGRRANDSTIRQALIDLFPPLGGGKVPQIGTIHARGPLYGIHSHEWAALAVAVVYALGERLVAP